MCQKQNVAKNVLGFDDVSSLVAFHYNTPNNTLGLFWQDLVEFTALFQRIKKQHTTLKVMQRNAKNRKHSGEAPVIYGMEDGKTAVMLTYCLGQTGGVSVEAFAETFGFTASQADNALKNMIEQGYVTNDVGRFYPTAKLKSRLFTSRIKSGQSRFKEAIEEQVLDEQVKFQPHKEYIPGNF